MTRYENIGGLEKVLQEVREIIEYLPNPGKPWRSDWSGSRYPIKHPEIFQHLGVDPPRGVLLHGPPGCGKTLLANAIAGELGVPFLKRSAPELVSGMSGESEKQVPK
jgi:ribosome biogenesis ATPase